MKYKLFVDVQTIFIEVQTNYLAIQTAMLKRLDKNTEDISSLKTENKKLIDKLNLFEEKFIKLDQYSRKYVAILTGLQLTEGETQSTLENKVLLTACNQRNY